MHRIRSLALSALVLLVAAVWLGTGTFVSGGKGPGEGATPILAFIEGGESGPISNTLGNAGLLAENHFAHDAEEAAMTIAQRNELHAQENGALLSVRTQTFSVQPMPVEVPLRGATQARAKITAVAETAGTVREMHVSKGQRVEEGDLLCTLDSGTRQAAVAQAEAGLDQARASLAQAQLDFDTNAQLRERGLAAANSANAAEVGLASAQASVRAAEAALENANAELDRTRIVAEVSGLVEDPIANRGAMLAQGAACATIVQLDPIVFKGNVPEVHIGMARTGLPALVRTVTGQEAEGEVTFIAASADAATRSFPVEIEVDNPDFTIRDGVTANATVNLGSLPGHLLPQSALTLNDDGVLGVRSVEDGVVAFHAVTIVSDTREGVWVSGLPATIDVIILGQEFVKTGQRVNASPASAAETTPESGGA